MITVSASYVSGDRDNVANGVRVAVAGLLSSVADRQGLAVVRYVSHDRADPLVTFQVSCPPGEAYERFRIGFRSRGGPVELLTITLPVSPPYGESDADKGKAQAGPARV